MTWPAIHRWVRHVHVKDSVSRPSGRHPYSYVFLGEGEFPLRSLVEQLRSDGFEHVLSLEWERMWHPYLPSVEEALERAVALSPAMTSAPARIARARMISKSVKPDPARRNSPAGRWAALRGRKRFMVRAHHSHRSRWRCRSGPGA